MRHGEAVGPDVDVKRPLSATGREEVVKLARYLARLHIDVQQLLHSPLLRAQQTAAIMAKALAPEKITEVQNELDATADVTSMLKMIRYWQQDTLLVGHLPFMPKLFNALLLDNDDTPIINMPPATIVCLSSTDHVDWCIDWMLNPTMVA